MIRYWKYFTVLTCGKQGANSTGNGQHIDAQKILARLLNEIFYLGFDSDSPDDPRTRCLVMFGLRRIHSFQFLGKNMSGLVKDTAHVINYLRKLRGGSQPILAQASDGLTYVVKFTNNLQGANLPFNESIGTELYKACGLSVPTWRPLLVTDTFLDRNPGCWMQTEDGRLRPDSGLCFGSRFLGGEDVTLFEFLASNSLARVHNRESFWLAWMIDICAQHTDNRQAVFLEDGKRRLDAFFVDQGSLFGGPTGEKQPGFVASRYLDQRIYQNLSLKYSQSMLRTALSLDTDQLWKQMQMLPDDWKTESAIEGFELCLDRLSKAIFLLNVIDTMFDANRKGHGCIERTTYLESTLPILCSGIQAKRPRNNLAHV
jgi:hypothetical protein